MKKDDPNSIEDRLRRALNVDLHEIREGVDMSPSAITARVQELAALSDLCLELRAIGSRPR